MTLSYDIEMLRVALERTIAAANAMMKHEHLGWLLYRLVSIRDECESMRDALEAYETETKGGAS